jgi:3-isopropylmalate/(R)-2-methylmalate dehydratase large subunit
MIAPDETTFEYLRGRPRAPQDAEREQAIARWRQVAGDDGAAFDREVAIDAAAIEPMISYGTNPGMVMAIDGRIPDGQDDSFRRAMQYMGLAPGEALLGRKVDVVFVGSCTNSRLSDLRSAASVLRGRKIASGVQMLVVPGSQQIKAAAEAEGLHKVFLDAGAQWRESGCSMCLGMNGDTVAAGEYSVSTSNRNFEGRQGAGARTLLASPLTAAAAAVRGVVADRRELMGETHGTDSANSFADGRSVERRYRYGPNHPGALPHDDHQGRSGQEPVWGLALRERRHAATGFCPQSYREPRRSRARWR